MRYIKLIFVFLLFSCESMVDPFDNPGFPNDNFPELPPQAKPPFLNKPKVRLTIMMGQSNCGFHPAKSFNYFYSKNVKGFSWAAKQFVDSLSFRQISNHRFSPLILIADKMRTKFPEDQLYFYQFHVGGTDLYYQWNPERNLLYKTATDNLDIALSLMPTPDIITVIWVQGESDTKTWPMADAYYDNQVKLYTSLIQKYGVDYFLTYIPYIKNGRLNTVKKAKYDFQSGTNKTVEIPVILNDTYIGPHMTVKGVLMFSDSVINKIK